MKSATEYPTNTAIALLLAGDTGTGKSTHLFNWPKPWIADLEGNLKGAIEHHRHAGTLPEWWFDRPEVDAAGKPVEPHKQFDNVRAQVAAAMADSKVLTVCVDGFGKLCDLLKEKLVNEVNAAEKPLIIGGMKAMTQSLWNPFANLLKSFMWDARRYNKPFIVTAHLKVDQNELTTVKEQQIDLQGQLQQSFPKLFSDYFQTMTEQVSDKAKYPRGVRYYLRTAPTMRNPSLKTSFVGLPPDLEPGTGEFDALLKRVAGGGK